MNTTISLTVLRRRIGAPRRKTLRAAAVAAVLGMAAVAVSTNLAVSAPRPAAAASVADAIPHTTVASGGGCSTSVNPAPHVARLQSCVSENRSHQIVSDVHVTLAGPRNGLSDCSYTISVRDDTARNTVARQTRSGCWTTPAPVMANAMDGHHYHTYVWETVTDRGGVHRDPNTYNSPEQIASNPPVVDNVTCGRGFLNDDGSISNVSVFAAQSLDLEIDSGGSGFMATVSQVGANVPSQSAWIPPGGTWHTHWSMWTGDDVGRYRLQVNVSDNGSTFNGAWVARSYRCHASQP